MPCRKGEARRHRGRGVVPMMIWHHEGHVPRAHDLTANHATKGAHLPARIGVDPPSAPTSGRHGTGKASLHKVVVAARPLRASALQNDATLEA